MLSRRSLRAWLKTKRAEIIKHLVALNAVNDDECLIQSKLNGVNIDTIQAMNRHHMSESVPSFDSMCIKNCNLCNMCN
jgi:hypothetical protein